jgi:uncharacterized protein (TIGR02246 family)
VSLSESDIQNIRELSSKFAKNIVEQDFEGVASIYTEDATLMPPGPAVNGRPAIKEWMAAFPPVSKFELNIDDIDGEGDLAYVRGHFHMVLHPEGAPEPVDDRGKYLEVRRKQADGSWLMSVDTFNSDS